MIQKLAQFTDIDAALIVGGLSLQAQAAALRAGPAIVVATPGERVFECGCACLQCTPGHVWSAGSPCDVA
jgi:hypothetical protein